MGLKVDTVGVMACDLAIARTQMEAVALVLTIVLSTACAGGVTYSLHASRDRLFFFRVKAEELYRAIDALDCELSEYFARRYSLLDRRAQHPPNDVEALSNPLFVVVKMMIGFYFPALAAALARMLAAAESATYALLRCDGAPDVQREDLVLVLDEAVSELRDALHALKQTLIAHQTKRPNLAAMLTFGSKSLGVSGRVLQVTS
jgi:hypothetical protein